MASDDLDKDALEAVMPWSSANAHLDAWRLALRALGDTGSVAFPLFLRRRLRRFVRSRMPVSSSRPIRVCGCAFTMDFAMLWLVCSFNRLSRPLKAILRRVAERVPFFCKRFWSRA